MVIKKFKIILFIFLILFNLSCSKKIEKKSLIVEKSMDMQILAAWNEGLKELKAGDALFAAKKFNEVEILFPQSDLAPKSALMAAYSYYTQDYLDDAIAELDRFIIVYPQHKNIDYAYYLMAISYYEKIVDEKKDLQSIINAKENFEIIINNFSNTEFALDSEFKLDLIMDILASKEMYLGRYYFEKKKWIPAINRFRSVIDDYETTIYVEEALHRLVEIYFILGLKDESEKYAKLLGYNYNSSKWYEMTYSVFDKNYEIKKKKLDNKKRNILISKFRALLNLDE